MAKHVAGHSSFASVVQWAVDTYHEGVVFHLASRVGISPALADRWVKGAVKHPTIETVTKFCVAYDLALLDVLKLVAGPPPPPPPRRRREPHPIGGGSGAGGTLPLLSLADALPLIGRWWPLRWGWLSGPGLTWSPA